MSTFIGAVREIVARAASPERRASDPPAFAGLLADDDWLPAEYAATRPRAAWAAGSASGCSSAPATGSLSLFSLVVPSGAQTPVHDHLAWGLVGLYRGTQDEEMFARGRGARVRREALADPGDFYPLLPPRDDIHRVRTTSDETSVSIHLLSNDTGCAWRPLRAGHGRGQAVPVGVCERACEE